LGDEIPTGEGDLALLGGAISRQRFWKRGRRGEGKIGQEGERTESSGEQERGGEGQPLIHVQKSLTQKKKSEKGIRIPRFGVP